MAGTARLSRGSLRACWGSRKALRALGEAAPPGRHASAAHTKPEGIQRITGARVI